MKITINEIAKRAGVSKATVSRVLNNSKPVSEDIKNRVLSVIQDTNFKPNAVARSLSLKKSHLIGIIIPDLSNPVFSRIIAGIESYIRSLDYSLLITATDFDIEMKIQHIHILKDKGVDGLILVTDHGNSEFYQAMLAFEKPIIMIGSESYIDTIPVVRIDNYKAACEATQYLIDLGHEKIGMIRGPLTDPQSGKERYDGYKDTLIKAGLFEENLIAEGWYSFDDGYRGMEMLLSKSQRVTAVFCACDLMAVGAMKYANEQGISVPSELSILGFDDVEIARMYSPSLTTVKQPFEESGRLAIETLVQMVEDAEHRAPFKHQIIKHQLVVRESTVNRKREG
ncbi:LacI family DNA-binding transcriptional regulator [Fusibacter bizertensis]